MTFTSVMIFSLLFSLYGIISKRLKWIYWLNSMNNVIPAEKRSRIDWEGYSNVMGNIISISGFVLVTGWMGFSILGKIKYFPTMIIPLLILLIWGQYGYSLRRFDKQTFTNVQREKMRIARLEYYNLDIIFTTMMILVSGLKYLIMK